MIEVSQHQLVPKHEILTKQEREEILNRLGITLNELPKMFSNDPAIRGLNSKVGDVVKITRMSITAGETVYYRTVIQA